MFGFSYRHNENRQFCKHKVFQGMKKYERAIDLSSVNLQDPAGGAPVTTRFVQVKPQHRTHIPLPDPFRQTKRGLPKARRMPFLFGSRDRQAAASKAEALLPEITIFVIIVTRGTTWYAEWRAREQRGAVGLSEVRCFVILSRHCKTSVFCVVVICSLS
jgi:hypothetical protein